MNDMLRLKFRMKIQRAARRALRAIIFLSLLILLHCLPSAAAQKFPHRIISLAPNMTEIIFFLGFEKHLIGVTNSCDYPKEAEKIEKIGDYANPNIEKIVSLKPDLILTSNFRTHPAFERMKQLRLPIYDFAPADMEGVIADIEEIGRMLGAHKLAQKRAGGLKKRVESIKRKHARQKEKPRVFVEVWYDPIMTVGSRSFVSDMLKISGAQNIFSDIKIEYPKVSAESVIARNPEIIVLAYMTQPQNEESIILNRPGWHAISAVRERRVYADINPDLFLRPGPRLVEGLEKLEKTIYDK
ncbi:MAG: cobalamin-binding protein [bacterium]